MSDGVVLEIGAPEATEVDPELDGLDALDEGVPLEQSSVPEPLVRGLLAGMGTLAAQVSPEYLEPQFTDEELDGIVPPITRIINRRPALVAAVHRGDEYTVAAYLAGYVGRNAQTARRARHEDRQRQAEESEGLGRPAARADGGGGDGRGGGDHAAPGAGFHPAPSR